LIDVGDTTLAITTDSLTEHIHFFPGVDPASLGHKALAVNLSDLAAAGARPPVLPAVAVTAARRPGLARCLFARPVRPWPAARDAS